MSDENEKPGNKPLDNDLPDKGVVDKGAADKDSGQQGSGTTGMGQKGVAKARGKSRRLAMQAIYQWQMTGDSITDIKQQFIDENNFSKIDLSYFSELVSGVAGSISELDPLLEKFMTRLIESVDPVERAILRIATYEFLNRLDVPYRVVLNEAISIAKEFCAENSHKFINAVLDKVAKEIRHIEVQADAKPKSIPRPVAKPVAKPTPKSEPTLKLKPGPESVPKPEPAPELKKK